ncbi:tetraspanin-4 isoform X3 [Neopelma chrysocephalum]|uniref:tetraspanin-4 isoform X3 n=1 Tax=Neopelma chrysocephalum TaxID=114329 RepID=UPI000FCD4332|nr:tetraspanin-4 isoform X3 [Neopelma chrysocephalum]
MSPVYGLWKGHLVNWDHIRCSELPFLNQLGTGSVVFLSEDFEETARQVLCRVTRGDSAGDSTLQLGGCGILGVGIWLAVTQGNFATLSSSFPSLSAANLLIVTGTFVMIIGFVGCIGAIKENKCLLLSFFIMLLIIFLLELTVVILFFVYTDKIDKYAQRDLKKGLHLYGTDGNIGLTNAWSIIQTDFRCCGVSNYTDWFEVYNTTRVPDSCCLEFSENCGLHSPGTWWKAPCYETVKIWLQENLLAVGIFGLCTAMVQILGLTFAMTMYCQVVKADTYCA